MTEGGAVAPLSVLHFSNALVRGGAEEHILTLLRGFDRRLFRLHLACTPEVAAALGSDLPGDVELFPLRLNRPSQILAAIGLARILRSRRVDVLHSHLFYGSLFASPIGWLCRVPLIVETPHVREQWRTGWLRSRFVVDRLSALFVDRFIAVSMANGRYLTGQKRLPARKIVVIQNGCDVERFDPEHRPPPGLRSSLGFDDGDPVIVVVARLEPQKGHRVLLVALQEVVRRFPRARLVCVGSGALRDDLEARTRALGLTGSVRFVGYQSNIADWLALADLTVLPSFYEGLPLVAIESLAAGRPMVATAVDGTPEVVVDGETGLTVPPGEAASLADAITRLLADPEERRRMGAAARRWALDHFTDERQVRRTEELYVTAVEQQRRRVRLFSSPRRSPSSLTC
jgi:L-malate glycosyltransferase